MIGWLRRLFARRPRPFDADALRAEVLRLGEASGRPRGLRWAAVEANGEPVFVEVVALLPVVIRFEPVAGSEMEEVEAAREPRPAVAICRWDGRAWRPDPKPTFNLSVEQVIERGGFRI